MTVVMCLGSHALRSTQDRVSFCFVTRQGTEQLKLTSKEKKSFRLRSKVIDLNLQPLRRLSIAPLPREVNMQIMCDDIAKMIFGYHHIK